jgi:hypothetical protein
MGFYLPDRICQYNTDNFICRMVSSGMLRRVALLITAVSEERSASSIRVRRIDELGTTLAVNSNRHTHSYHPDEGGAKFLRNFGSYNSHTA